MVTVLHLITGLETGGAEGMLARLVTRTDRSRVRPVVVSMTDTGAVGPLIAGAGIPVEALGIRRGVVDPRGVTRLIRVLRRHQPDIVQTWLYHADLLGLIAARLGHAPHLLWNIRCSDMAGPNVVRGVLSRLSGLPETVIINSLAGRRFHEGIGYRPRRWEYIPNGYDTALLRPDEGARLRFRAALGIDSGAIVIGMPARFHPMKDHAGFLAAARRMAADPTIVFVLLGSGIGPANPDLVRAIEAEGLMPRIRLLGERADMSAVYPALDIATLSSAFGEGFPNVLAEAMACGVPCVATDTGDAAEILGECGIIVPPRDPEALAAGWQRMIALGAEGRRALGIKARARIVENYDLDRIVSRFEALYCEIADRPGQARSHPAAFFPP
jgi:glycosyltransferase involved in cell wall biosynthesis